MFEVFTKLRPGFLFWLLIAACCFCNADPLDTSRYIGLDEIKPGMDAYCLTCYKGTKVEKFTLEVLDVIRNARPGRDAILVQGTDPRFIHTGPVMGCSGSPVYINGRLAGALAWAWGLSKDPLYQVTPIEEMLEVGRSSYADTQDRMAFAFDFTTPIDIEQIDRQITQSRSSMVSARRARCPLVVSGLPESVCELLAPMMRPLGFMPVAGIGGGSDTGSDQDTTLVPGATLAIPLVEGDIKMAAIGTVTEVDGDKVYAFGHNFFGYGAIDLPMATGKVHTIVSNLYASFKLASALKTVGALQIDEAAAVVGRIGAKAKMIPLTITVDRYNDTQQQVYNCRIANNRIITPSLLGASVAGAAYMRGSLPPDNTVEYKVTIDLEGADAISFANISTSVNISEMIRESIVPVAVIMNNPYQKVDLKSIDIDINIEHQNLMSRIWSVNLSDSTVKAGQTIDVEVVLESVLSPKKKFQYRLTIPQDLRPGKYEFVVMGGYDYVKFLRKKVPQRFIPQNLTSLIDALNKVLRIKRDRLYCVLALPSGGVSLDKAELPDLPATKALILQDAKRTLRTKPYSHWLEKSFDAGLVVIDRKLMRIKVER